MVFFFERLKLLQLSTLDATQVSSTALTVDADPTINSILKIGL